MRETRATSGGSQDFHNKTMPTAMASQKEAIPTSTGMGGLGKPSTVMASDNNHRGRRLARVASHEASGNHGVFFMVSMGLSFQRKTVEHLYT
jgi:hypothetical protein